MKLRLLLPAALLWLAAACGESGPPLLVEDVVITRPLPASAMSAGYLTLRNSSADPIVIDRVTSPEFAAVEMHESILEDGIAHMHSLESVVVAPGASVRFEPGGKHLMLMRPAAGSGPVTLHFHSGEVLLLSVTTRFED